jgi:hypothetical protein
MSGFLDQKVDADEEERVGSDGEDVGDDVCPEQPPVRKVERAARRVRGCEDGL